MSIQRLFLRSTIFLMAAFLTMMWNVKPVLADQEPGHLDGRTFIGETGRVGKKGADVDELIFKNGMFRSKGCDRYGFEEATYTATIQGDVVTFEAETMSPKQGKMKWTGTMKGDQLEGTYTWYRSNKWYRLSNEPVEYWIKAELKK
jgi:hypothetical protein